MPHFDYNKNFFLYCLIGIIILFNLLLIYQLVQNRARNNRIENYANTLIYQNKKQEDYIKQSLQHPISSFETFLQYIQERDSIFFSHDTVFILLLPQNACYTCVSDLFLKLNQLKIDSCSIYLFMSNQDKQIQREWLSYHFKHYCIDDQKIFLAQKLKEDLIIMKVIKKKDK